MLETSWAWELLPYLLLAGPKRAETNQVFVNLFALSFCQLSMISQEGRKGQREQSKELVPSDPLEDNPLGMFTKYLQHLSSNVGLFQDLESEAALAVNQIKD